MNDKFNPEMMVLARQSRGLTQLELAKKLQIAQGNVSKAETGYLNPSEEMINDLAKVLGYNKKFFYQNFEIYPVGSHLYRKHKTLSSKVLEQISAKMNIWRQHIKQLMLPVEMEYKEMPEFVLSESKSPMDIAKEAREYLRLPRGPITSMTRILEDLGAVVISYDFQTSHFSGASIFTENPNYIVILNSNMPLDRMRFTLSHELGHMLMHRCPKEGMEEDADLFASEFLMPTQDIKPYLTNLPNLSLPSLVNLKKYWKVSMGAILMKAKQIGVISDRQYSKLWTEMGKSGYRTKEPIELEIPEEKPTIITELIDIHLNELGYSPKQLADMVNHKQEEFNSLYIPAPKGLKLVRAIR